MAKNIFLKEVCLVKLESNIQYIICTEIFFINRALFLIMFGKKI